MPVIVDRQLLEHYWRRDTDYYPSFRWPPHSSWFPRFDGATPVSFRPGVAYFENGYDGKSKIHFSNGRHRTRWLIEKEVAEVVIALSLNTAQAAIVCGLVAKKINHGDRVNFGFRIDEIEWP
jgi:hypothetical protein